MIWDPARSLGRHCNETFLFYRKLSKANESEDFLKLRHYEDKYTIFLIRKTADILGKAIS